MVKFVYLIAWVLHQSCFYMHEMHAGLRITSGSKPEAMLLFAETRQQRVIDDSCCIYGFITLI